MDLSALERAIKALETSLDSLSVWLTMWTALVVLGLVVELTDELVKERSFKWRKHVLVIVGGLLITIGVAGELIVQFKASKVETILRADTHQVEALLNKQAADANKAAEDARSKSASAFVQVAQATKDAEVARRDAESSKLDIAKANARAADANQKAEELRASNLATEEKLEKERETRLELEKSIAPRSFVIKVAQSPNSNFEELKPFAGTNVVFEVLTDAEARRAANDIGNLAGFAGWKVVAVNANPGLWAGFFDGISIVPPPGFGIPPLGQFDEKSLATMRKTTRAANALALWLLDKNWKASVRNNIKEAGAVPVDTIKIFVGFKPNPFFDPQWVKDMEKQYKEILKQDEKMNEQIEKMRPKPPSQD